MDPRIDLGDFLANIPSLARLDDQELSALEHALSVDRYPDGHEFINENIPNDRVFLIVDGNVLATRKRVYLRGTDIYDRLEPGELFGLTALIDRRYPWATFRADGPVIAATLHDSAFELLFRSHARIAYCFQKLVSVTLARRVRATVTALDALFTEESEG